MQFTRTYLPLMLQVCRWRNDVREVSHSCQWESVASRGWLSKRSESDTALVCVILLSKNEWLASADRLASTDLAGSALKLQCNLLGGLGLLAEDGFGLTSETLLLGAVTTFTLCELWIFAFLVLRDLMDLMLAAFCAVCVFRLRSVHLESSQFRVRVVEWTYHLASY